MQEKLKALEGSQGAIEEAASLEEVEGLRSATWGGRVN